MMIMMMMRMLAWRAFYSVAGMMCYHHYLNAIEDVSAVVIVVAADFLAAVNVAASVVVGAVAVVFFLLEQSFHDWIFYSDYYLFSCESSYYEMVVRVAGVIGVSDCNSCCWCYYQSCRWAYPCH